MASEPVFGTGRARKPGTRRGYGQQKGGVKKGPESEDTSKRRKESLERLLADSKARTSNTIASMGQSQQAVRTSNQGIITAGNIVAAMSPPNLGGPPQVGGGGGGGGTPINGHGAAARLARKLSNKTSIEGITKLIGKWGGVPQAQSHHDETNVERDITFAAGTSPAETARLRVLYRAMMKAYGSPGESRAYTADDHWDHLHFNYTNGKMQELIFGNKAFFQ